MHFLKLLELMHQVIKGNLKAYVLIFLYLHVAFQLKTSPLCAFFVQSKRVANFKPCRAEHQECEQCEWERQIVTGWSQPRNNATLRTPFMDGLFSSLL